MQLLSAPPNDGDAEADDGYTDPAISTDPLAQKRLRSKRSSGIAERADGHYETDFLKGKNGEQGEKAQAHERDARPHPRQAQGLQDESQNRTGAKIVDFADGLHRAADAQFAARSRHDNQKQKDNFTHDGPLLSCWARYGQR